MYPLKQSTAITIPFFVFDDAGDPVTGLEDGDVTKRIRKEGGTFGAMAVEITEAENGWYELPLSTAHTDTVGLLTITLIATGAKQVNLQFRVHAQLPDDLATAAALADVQADTDDIRSRLPAALVSGRIDASVGAYQSGQTPADHVLATPAQKLATDAAGRAKADVERWQAGTPNDLITGRVDANAQVVGDKTGYGLADGAITAAKIADGALTAAKAAAGFFDAVWSVATRTLTGLGAALVQEIWDRATSALVTAGSIGKLLVDNVDAAISSRSSHAAADVWEVGTRTLTSFGTLVADVAAAVWSAANRLLTAGTNIVLAKGTGITGFNDLSQADVRVAVGLNAADLDDQLGAIASDASMAAAAAVSAASDAAAIRPKVDTLHDTRLTAGRAENLDNLDAEVSGRAAPGDEMALTADALDDVAAAVGGEAVPELPIGQPPAVPSFRQAVAWLYMMSRNRVRTTGSVQEVHNDAGDVIARHPLSDDGSDFVRAKAEAP